MITKMGEEFIKSADLISAGVGAYRASNLSDNDRKLLIEEYGLPSDASLGWRNAGRGALGGIAGSLVGTGIGQVLAAPVVYHNPYAAAALLGAGNIGGYILGTRLATDKYSKGKADEIRKRRAMTKESSFGAGVIGMMRAGELTPEDKRLLCEEYDLPEDANMPVRNAARGYFGGLGGGIIGSSLGAVIGRAVANQKPSLRFWGPVAGALAGTGIGVSLATNKYSRRRADEIRERKAREAARSK